MSDAPFRARQNSAVVVSSSTGRIGSIFRRCRTVDHFTWRLFPRQELGRIATSLDFDALRCEQT